MGRPEITLHCAHGLGSHYRRQLSPQRKPASGTGAASLSKDRSVQTPSSGHDQGLDNQKSHCRSFSTAVFQCTQIQTRPQLRHTRTLSLAPGRRKIVLRTTKLSGTQPGGSAARESSVVLHQTFRVILLSTEFEVSIAP